MFCISVQVRPKYAGAFPTELFLQKVRPIRSPEIDDYEEKGKRLLSFNFFTEYPQSLWQQLQPLVFASDALGTALVEQTLILCEDDNDDVVYLLHHYDATEPLDALPADTNS